MTTLRPSHLSWLFVALLAACGALASAYDKCELYGRMLYGNRYGGYAINRTTGACTPYENLALSPSPTPPPQDCGALGCLCGTKVVTCESGLVCAWSAAHQNEVKLCSAINNRPCTWSGNCESGYCMMSGLNAGETPNCRATHGQTCASDINCATNLGLRCSPTRKLCLLPDAQQCVYDSSCESGDCTNHLCVGSTCSDKKQNGSETATDCGGGVCGPCGDGQSCKVKADCGMTSTCDNGTCKTICKYSTDPTTKMACGPATQPEGCGPVPRCGVGSVCPAGDDSYCNRAANQLCLNGACTQP